MGESRILPHRAHLLGCLWAPTESATTLVQQPRRLQKAADDYSLQIHAAFRSFRQPPGLLH
eukprot:10049410-Alexandrium_andersonii.AAC.1